VSTQVLVAPTTGVATGTAELPGAGLEVFGARKSWSASSRFRSSMTSWSASRSCSTLSIPSGGAANSSSMTGDASAPEEGKVVAAAIPLLNVKTAFFPALTPPMAMLTVTEVAAVFWYRQSPIPEPEYWVGLAAPQPVPLHATSTVGADPVTVTVTARVVEPPVPVAVRVYTLVAAGVTVLLVPVTVPTPWSMDNEVAPVTAHASVEDAPAAMVEGVAVNEEMTGVVPGLTVTVVVAVVLPAEFVAVRV